MRFTDKRTQNYDSNSSPNKSKMTLSKSRFFGKTMFKQFSTMYLALIALFFIYTQIIDPVLHQTFSDDIREDKIHDYEGIITLLSHLYPIKNQAQWQELLYDLNSESNVPIAIMTLAQVKLAPKFLQQIALGQPTMPHYPEDIHYQLIAPNIVAKVGPMGINNKAEFAYSMIEFSPLILFGGFTLFWVVVMQVRLLKLEYSAKAFSYGKFDARAPLGLFALGDLSKVFNQMAERLNRLFQSQKHLTNAVSHELRSPISRLRFQLEMVADAEDANTRSQSLAGMVDDLDDMEDLIHELLTYTRLESAEPLVKFEQVNICQWLFEQRQHFLPEICNIIRLVTPDIRAKVAMNSPLMSRLLRNLVSNADKYAKSIIIIGASIDQKGYKIWVDDDGIGIPAEQSEQLFKPFTRLDTSRNKKTGGYGIGLAIVAQIVRQHHGTVTIEKSNLGGTRMLVTWPTS